MNEVHFNPDRPVRSADLRVGLRVWSPILNYAVEVKHIGDQTVLFSANSRPLPVAKVAIDASTTMFFHIDGASEPDPVAELRAEALRLIEAGHRLSKLADAIASRKA